MTNIANCGLPAVNLPSRLFAHSLPGVPTDNWQRLDIHLSQVARCAEEFAEAFDSAAWAWNAGLLHDLGKASDGFQAYLLRENDMDDSAYDAAGIERGNHSSAGAALAERCHNRTNKPFGRILAYTVAGHHAGLPDYYSCDGGMGALQTRLKEGMADLGKIKSSANAVAALQRPLDKLPPFVEKRNLHFWVRMLFSTLVDADYLDTEAFVRPESSSHRSVGSPLSTLKHDLDLHMADKISTSEDTPVNRIRREVLDACRAAASENPGLFTLTVPTGGGKTLAAMTFALDHAIKYEKKRVIYVIPYTSIIEQTAAILADIFGLANVVEHHSNLDPEKETLRMCLAAENWDAPIIVTTNVQFFESLFAARPSRCRKLHNLVNSVVILDEAQLVPPNKLEPCVAAINELVQNYGVTMVLSTATQPVLPKLQKTKEIVPESLNLYKRLMRTSIHFPEDLNYCSTWESVAERLQQHDQVLCIVNTRRDCHDLYRLMPAGTIHLSALMCGEHRMKTIQHIKDRLRDRNPIRVVSTQLVEAGVDMDFPVVFRALAGLDSIAQAAGRCNREGKLPQQGKVEVFVPPNPAPVGLLHKGETTTRELHQLPAFDPQAPETFARYFDLFYSKINDVGAEFLKDLTPSDPFELDIAFRKIGDSFRLIDDRACRPVFVRYGKGADLLRELQYAGPRRELMRDLQRYTVNLPARQAEEMLFNGLLEEIWPGYLAQCSLSIYNDSFGLDVFRDGFPIADLTGV